MSDTKRKDWELNQKKIETTIIEFIGDQAKMPSFREIAQHTGLSKRSVQRHMDEIDLSAYTEKLKVLSQPLLVKLFQKAMEGKSARFMELWFKVVEGLDSKKHVDVTTKGESISPSKATITLSNGTEIEI